MVSLGTRAVKMDYLPCMLCPSSISHSCQPACRLLFNFSSQSQIRNQPPLHPCSANSPYPQNLTEPPEENLRQDLAPAAASTPCPPRVQLLNGHRVLFLNQTIFSQTAPRLEKETWQLPVGREEGTPLMVPGAPGPEESSVSVLPPLPGKG